MQQIEALGLLFVLGTAALYMFTDGFKRVHELLMFDDNGHRSWFIGSTVLAGWYLSFLSDVALNCLQ